VIPSHLSLTIPYDPKFSYRALPEDQWDFRSMSLAAAVKVCRDKNYRLIGAHSLGFNAFFLRNDEGIDIFPEVSIESVHDNAYTRHAQTVRWSAVKDLPWAAV
jgi:hypothetical protein